MFIRVIARIIRALRVRAALHAESSEPELDQDQREYNQARAQVLFACRANELDSRHTNLILSTFDNRWVHWDPQARGALVQMMRERAARFRRIADTYRLPEFLRDRRGA